MLLGCLHFASSRLTNAVHFKVLAVDSIVRCAIHMIIEMPSDALAVAVTTGLGVSVLAGVISGICYILSQGLKRKGTPSLGTPWHCSVCGSQFRSIQGILEVEKVVKCAKCQQKVCRIRCSRRDPVRGWICQICQQPETWFKTILKAIHPSKGHIFSKMEAGDELDDDLMELRKKEREQVRDFIERLVESFLGGNLDEVNVGRIYNDMKYLPITGQSPCTAHAALKNLIQRFSSEAAALPELKRIQDHPAVPEEDTSDRTYEDLLSTAIINKVVENCQNGSRSATDSLCSRSSRRSKRNSNKEYFFSEETLEDKWKKNHGTDDSSSISSIDEWVRSESSLGSAKYVDRISLTIKQHIDDGGLSNDDGSDMGSNHDSFLDTEDNWNENWYLQKRRLTNSHSPVPVPMLVPNPLNEAKVFIGDREANDISDVESDYGENEVAPDIKHILVNSRTIIGGKNIIETVDDLNGIISQEDVAADVEIPKEEETLEEIEIKAEDIMDVSLLSIDSNTEKDTEYTEQYASLPRTIVKEPKPTPRMSKVNELKDVASSVEHHDVETMEEDGYMSEVSIHEHLFDDELPEEPEDHQVFEGSYSRKEKEKWRNSVEMPNNPYSPENLERRLSSRSSTSSANSLYGRDYYVKLAAQSAGSRKKMEPNDDNEMQPYDQDSEVTLVTAIPALVTPDDEEPSSDICPPSYSSTPPPPIRPNQLDLSSDSDLSIERIYNLQSGIVIQNLGGVSQEFTVEESESPECTKYVQKEFDSYIDENHNNTIDVQKREFLRSLTCESNPTTPVVMEDIVASIFANYNEGNEISTPDTPISYEANPEQPTEVRTKLKETLDTFDNIANEFKVPKDGNMFYTHQYDLVADRPQEPIEEFGYILKTKDLSTYQIPAKYFGDAKNFYDSKASTNTSDYSEEDVLSENKEFSLEYSTDMTEDVISRPDSSAEADPEITDLKQKKLVKDLLGHYSKNFPNVSTVVHKKSELEFKREASVENVTTVVNEVIQNGDQANEEEEIVRIPSVRNLKKMFDRDNEGKKDSVPVCSLTARSLPTSFTQQLKSDEDLSIKQENQTNEATDESQEELPADITRSRIAFFENLEKKKFRTAQ